MSGTPRTDEHLRMKAENGLVAVVSREFARQLERELTEARAVIERLNKNMRFATAINLAMQEVSQDLPDLRGHECLAKHKLLSLFDFWRKKVRPRLPGFIDDEISQRDKLIEQMRRALEYALTEARSTECERLIKAALSAAGMGGKWAGNEQV